MADRGRIIEQQAERLRAQTRELTQQVRANPELKKNPQFLSKVQKNSQQIDTLDRLANSSATGEQITAALAANEAYDAQAQANAEATAATEGTPSAEAGGETRELTCPFCQGEVLVKRSGKPFSSVTAWLQRSPALRILTPVFELLGSVVELLPVSKQAIVKECPSCKNERKLEDPSDDRAKYAAAAAIAQSKAPEIQELEARLSPPGGNRYTIIQGSDLLEVGLGMNDAPSYRVDKDMGRRNWGVNADMSNIDTQKGGLQLPKGVPANHVQGLNTPASPGGHYVIKCSNKFSLVTGAQGVDIVTSGPVNISGGITQITGPEVSVGSSTGRLLLEGETVNVSGKSIEVAPSDGHFFVKGTASMTGNMIVGGHAHAESASIVKLETTGRNEPSKQSSASNIYGGPAFWGGVIPEGIAAALKELLSFTVNNANDPEKIKTLVSLRTSLSLADCVTNLLYMERPIELVPTGICIVNVAGVLSEGVVFNFPHIHALPDGVHTHETRIPDIKCDADSAAELRKSVSGVDGPAPLMRSSGKLLEKLWSVWKILSIPFISIASTIQQYTYNK
jgi:hypothetical protein